MNFCHLINFCKINYLYSDDFPIHIDTISMGLPILHFKGAHVELF